MAITKRDRALIAQVINSVGGVEGVRHQTTVDTLKSVADTFAATFSLMNDKFDVEEFMELAISHPDEGVDTEALVPPEALVEAQRND